MVNKSSNNKRQEASSHIIDLTSSSSSSSTTSTTTTTTTPQQASSSSNSINNSNNTHNYLKPSSKRLRRTIVLSSDSEQETEEESFHKKQKIDHSSNKQTTTTATTATAPIPTTMSGFTRRRTTTATTPSGQANHGNGATPKKSLKIKPFALKTPGLPANFEQDTWSMLHDAVDAIHKNEPIHISQEELYKAVNDMCLHKFEKSLFIKLEKTSRENVQENIFAKKLRVWAEKFSSDYITFLSMISDVWDNYCTQLSTIASIFLYLDRTFVVSSYNLNQNIEEMGRYRSLRDMGLQQFRSELLNMRNAQVLDRIISGLLSMVQSERDGDNIDRRILQKLIRMLVSLQIYAEHFEGQFLKQTEKFYMIESNRLVQERNVSEYLLYVENRLHQENERAQSYLFAGTKRPLIACVERECIQKHVELIVERGFDELIQEHRLKDLSRMYDLFKLVNELERLKLAFVNYIKKKGEAIVHNDGYSNGSASVGSVIIEDEATSSDKPIEMVEEVLRFKEKIDEILKVCFKNNETFVYGMKSGFEYFINSRQNQPAEYIAKFIDQKLRSGSKSLNDEELEKMMDDTMVLFKFISGKDVFEAFYKKDLAKRLLLGRSASFDAEKSMISRLKTESGKQFTSKLEGMFRDIDVSSDLMTEFKKSKEYSTFKKENASSKNIDLNVTVITSGFWPSYPEINARFPSNIEPIQEVFKKFYLDKHSGRVLKWQNSLGQCTLRAHFPLGSKDILASVFQASILFLFNDKDTLSYSEIKSLCGIDDEGELRRTLQSLTLGKVKVLTKTPAIAENSIDSFDPQKVPDLAFHYNKDFHHSLIRIRINSIQIRETKQEQAETTEKILLERQYAIDAAIVRIMKARKQLSHQQLVTEIFKQLKFPIKAIDIKKRIETLIEREYIERVNVDVTAEDAHNTATTTGYKYLA